MITVKRTPATPAVPALVDPMQTPVMKDATRIGYAAYRAYEEAREHNLPEFDDLPEHLQREYVEMGCLFTLERELARKLPAAYAIFRDTTRAAWDAVNAA